MERDLYTLPSSVGARGPSALGLGCALIVATIASAIATQVFATTARYAPALGHPLAQTHLPYLASVYEPWAWVRWAFVYANPLSKFEYPPAIVAAVGTLVWTLFGGAVATFIAYAAGAIGDRPAKARELVDSAGWATAKDLAREGFFRKAGPIIGGFKTRGKVVPLRYDGENGVEHLASPGDDKSTQAKTNLLIPLQREQSEREAMYGDTPQGRRADFWGEEPTIIVLDVKALVDSTAGYQKDQLGKDVLLFEPLAPTNEGRACYNSLWDVRVGTDFEPDDAYQGSYDLVDADGKGLPTYWDSACTAFGGAIIATLGYRALQTGRPEMLSLPYLVDYISSHVPQPAVKEQRAVPAQPGKAAIPGRPGRPAMDGIEVLIEDMLRPHDPNFTFAWKDEMGQPTAMRAWIVSAARAMQNKAGEERALDENTRVLTPTGYRLMRELTVGDFVIGKNGLPTRVCGVYPQGVRAAYRVTFRGGASAICCDDHLWQVTADDTVAPDVVWPLSKIRWCNFRTLRIPTMAGRQDRHAFESIKEVSARAMICIKVEAPDGLFVIEDYIVTHNSGVYGTFIEKLGIFRSGVLRKHISTATFTFRELANRPNPAIVYFKIPAMQLNQFRPLVRIFVRSAIRQLTESSGTIDGREVRGNLRSTVIVLDEVASLRRDDEIATASGYLRGHGVMLMTLWQTMQQKLQHYGEHEAITATMGVHVFGRPEDDRDAERTARALGQFSVEYRKHNRSQAAQSSTSEHTETQVRQLATARELKRLPRDENVVFSRGLTIRSKKFPYWKNPILNARARLPRPPSDVLSHAYFIANLTREIGVDKVAHLKLVPKAVAHDTGQEPEQTELALDRVTIPRTLDPLEAFRLGNAARG
ncbi:MAG: hypothetical protein NVS1B2_26500 [Vulcanimicrobiaceae bacterium]